LSKPKKEIEIGLCSYCGNEDEMEPEHVVPRSIFVNKNQSNIVIPACHACNNKKSAGEDDLRDWLIITVGVDGHPDIYPLMFEMRDAYEKGFSKIGAAAREERELTLRQTRAGLHVPAYEVPFYDPQHMEMTLRYMVRGLYFALIGKPYLPDQPLSLTFVSNDDYQDQIDYFRSFVSHEWAEPMGNNVFNWMPITESAEQRIIPILMTFFGKVLVVGWIGRDVTSKKPQLSFDEMIRRKGKREKALRGIVDRRLVMPPPDDVLGFLRWHEEKKKKNPPGTDGN
jgi:hypothetical protein